MTIFTKDRSHPGTIARADILRACKSLKAVVVRQSTDYQALLFYVSAVLNGLQPMLTSELNSAMKLYAHCRRQCNCWVNEHVFRDCESLLQDCRDLFEVGDDKRVSFADPSMSLFLRTCAVRGMDASHRTLATICIAYLSVSRDEDGGVGTCLDPNFATYATAYRQRHYNATIQAGLGLDQEILDGCGIKSGGYLKHLLADRSGTKVVAASQDAHIEGDDLCVSGQLHKMLISTWPHE